MSKSILGLIFALLFALPSRAEQPIFTITSLEANPGEIIEIDFYVDNFTDIISAQFSINWNSEVLEYRTAKNFNPSVPGLTSSTINSSGPGELGFLWFEATAVNPITIPDGSLFFTIEFEVIGDPCQSTLVAITDVPVEIEVAEDTGSGEVQVDLVANNGTVTIPGTGCTEGINLIGNSVVAACGSEACIQFTVENFTTVGLMEFSLTFDPAVLQYKRFQNYAPLPVFGNGSTFQFPVGTPNLRVIWTHPNAENSDLPDGTVLFEVCFDVIGSGGQSSIITFGNNPVTNITDDAENPYVVNIQPAVITAQCALEGFAVIADSVCTEPDGLACIDISVNDFEQMLVLQFSMNWDATRFEFDHLEGFNLAGLDLTVFGVPPDVNQGQLTISWFDPDFEGITLPDFTTIFTVCLRPIGPPGSSSAFTFSGIPAEIEFATIDSTLTAYTLVAGYAQIQQDCEVVPCSISYTLNVTHPGCPGQSNGSIDLSVNTGNCPDTPTYLWSHLGATTQDISGLPAGPYSVTITLGTQIVVATDILVDPPAISVSANITHPIAPNPGAINITVTGGTPPYTFLWNTTPVMMTTEDLSNLLAGTYIVTVTDSRGCTFVPDPFIVGADLVGAITPASCPGSCNGSITASATFGTPPYTYSWNTIPVQTTPTINNLCPGIYCVTATDSGGSTRNTCFTVVTQTPPINVTATITHDIDENCEGAIDLNVTGGTNPITYRWSPPGNQTSQDILNLCEGEYCVTITYGANCTYDTCFTIFAGNIILDLTVTQYGNFQTSCNNICDGEIFSSVSGGTPPYTYLWSNNETTPDLTNLCPGIYSLTVTDANGNTASSSRTIVAPPALTFTTIKTDPTDFSLSDGSISIIANGGVPDYTYDWIGGNVASKNNLPHGTYLITVIDDNGCEVSGHVVLNPDGVPCYKANSIITPNSDGKNDFFFITCIFDADNHLFIFNRNGGLVYDTPNYTNNWTGVDGDNQPLPDGGYLWVLEAENPDGTTRILKGTVNLLRTAD